MSLCFKCDSCADVIPFEGNHSYQYAYKREDSKNYVIQHFCRKCFPKFCESICSVMEYADQTLEIKAVSPSREVKEGEAIQ